MSLEVYFEYTFSLMHNFKWSMSDVENMLPWERDVYLMKLEKQLAEEKRQQIEIAAIKSTIKRVIKQIETEKYDSCRGTINPAQHSNFNN